MPIANKKALPETPGKIRNPQAINPKINRDKLPGVLTKFQEIPVISNPKSKAKDIFIMNKNLLFIVLNIFLDVVVIRKSP